MAEREGFEPSKQVTPLGGLANRCTRPLCDLSVATAAGILSWAFVPARSLESHRMLSADLRKLLIALWKFARHGVVIEGAVFKSA